MKLPPAQVQAAQPEEVALAPPSTARRGQESYNSRSGFRFADPFGQKPLFEPESTIKKPKILKTKILIGFLCLKPSSQGLAKTQSFPRLQPQIYQQKQQGKVWHLHSASTSRV